MPKRLTNAQKYYRRHKEEIRIKNKERYEAEKVERNRKGKEKYWEDVEKSREQKRKIRAKNHAKNRKKDLADCKKYYQDNKEYHKRKNREHYEKNKDKWADKRKEISVDWHLAKVPKFMASRALEELGFSVEIDTDLTTFQFFSLIEQLGFNPKDCIGYKPFKSRYDRYYKEYLETKNTPK